MKTKDNNKSVAKDTLKAYWQHTWKHKWWFIGMLISVPLARISVGIIPPLIISDMLDRISRSDYVQGNFQESFGSQLILYAALFFFGGVIMWRVAIFFVWMLEMRVLRDIYQRIFAHLIRQGADFHDNRFSGSLVSQTNKFANSYVRLQDTMVFQILGLIVTLIFAVVILSPRVPAVAIAIVVISFIFFVLSIKVTNSIRKLNAEEAAAQNKQTGYLADSITNIMAIKSFAGGDYENRRFASATDKTFRATFNLMRSSLIKESFFAMTTTTLGVTTLAIALIAVVQFNADVSTVFLVIVYTGLVSENLWTFSQSTLRNINRSIGDSREMTEILAIEPTIKDLREPEECKIKDGHIVFDNVNFQYDENNENLFENLSFEIKPGQKIGLVGHSGGGKTTVTKLIMRYMDVNAGQILVDGQDIKNIRQDELRQNIAYVPQEPLLFHRSLYENIQYGNPETTEDQVLEASKMANADEFIAELPERYETLVGERGVKLSGGQRQRIAIARAMIKNAPILLLDEATSALDSESEVLIQEALWRLMEGRTAIVVAHRLSTIQKMDKIIVVDDGEIAESGTHKELIEKSGTYSKLWAHQSGGFLED
jgi:ATP-binding cassette, subfamily B, bacterial